MTRSEAAALCGQMNREHPERTIYKWLARPAEQGWEVVRVELPERGNGPLREGIEAAERPPWADDTRTAEARNVGGGRT
jgi:hypothetical protein